MNIHNRKHLKPFRKKLRNNLTTAEAVLWTHLSHSKLGFKFRRQHSVGKYVIDFYCAPERFAVELDGAGHFTKEGKAHDEIRTQYLNTLNITVIRFENVQVFEDLDGVLEQIKSALLGLRN